MAVLPTMKNEYQNREVTDCFSGYRRRLRIEDGELYDCMNLSTDHYPLLANRKKRGRICPLSDAGGLMAREKLAWVEGSRLYYDGRPSPIDSLSPGEKQLVGMGAYILIFPDKLYLNTADMTDYGSMEARYTSSGPVRYSLCSADGAQYPQPQLSASAPENPENGMLWTDSSQSPHVLRRYSQAMEQWVEESAVYTKLTFSSCGELPGLFRANDGISLKGSMLEELNGHMLIHAIGGGGEQPDYILLPGLLDRAAVQTEGCVSLERTVPDMDFVIECRNRLWGCRYGRDGDESLNELYCCALGDFRNWQQYRGLSSDSWRASVGSDGPWTGAVNFMGYPTFFKENRIHRISISSYGAHQLSETVCRGVQQGSGKSLCVVNETLFYKSPGDVCAWQGGFPQSVSEALGDERYFNAAAGALGDKYYISMENAAGEACLFVYDIRRGAWIKEDSLRCTAFACLADELYALADGALWALGGSRGETEPCVDWMAESGILYYQQPERKYLSRYNFRLQMEQGARMDIFLQYDSSGLWEHKGSISFKGTGTVTLPIRPRRCDHLRIRLVGRGEFRLFSIAKILSIGSDI